MGEEGRERERKRLKREKEGGEKFCKVIDHHLFRHHNRKKERERKRESQRDGYIVRYI